MAVSSLATRYEALLMAVREALELVEDGNYNNQEAREGIECILTDVLEEVDEPAESV